MAIAAGVAAAAATAVSTGLSVASQAGAFGSNDPGKPQIQQVPKRPFETAQQKYMTRVMMANINNRGPSYRDWLKSGGTATFQLQDTGMTPLEAQKMGFVGPGGRAPEWVDPNVASQQGLTPEQWQYGGMERGPKNTTVQARLGRVSGRIERLQGLAGSQEGGLRPGQQKRLDRLQSRQKNLMAKSYHAGSEEE